MCFHLATHPECETQSQAERVDKVRDQPEICYIAAEVRAYMYIYIYIYRDVYIDVLMYIIYIYIYMY